MGGIMVVIGALGESVIHTKMLSAIKNTQDDLHVVDMQDDFDSSFPVTYSSMLLVPDLYYDISAYKDCFSGPYFYSSKEPIPHKDIPSLKDWRRASIKFFLKRKNASSNAIRKRLCHYDYFSCSIASKLKCKSLSQR